MVQQTLLVDAEASFSVDFHPNSSDQLFILDIYAMESNEHPTFHFGWWAWDAHTLPERADIKLVYQSPTDVQVVMQTADGIVAPKEYWLNEEYKLAPLQQVSMVWQSDDGQRVQSQVTLGVTDDHLLQAYYADNAKRYSMMSPFIKAFHERRLAVLKRLFTKHIKPGARVIDVGSGHSMFYLIFGENPPFHVTCLDLDRTLITQIGPQRPTYRWLVAAMQELPFDDASYDVLYAGEIIEHVADPDLALAEWNRVLRPGGTLIVTTPNRERFLNRINKTNAVVSYEHLVEFTCDELRTMFDNSGFDMIGAEGIYVELLARWRQTFPYIDPITAMEPQRKYLLALDPLLRLGRFLPEYSFNLTVIGRKR